VNSTVNRCAADLSLCDSEIPAVIPKRSTRTANPLILISAIRDIIV